MSQIKMGKRPEEQVAAAVSDWQSLASRLLRELAELRGDVRFLVSTQLKAQSAEAALNALVAAIHAAMPPHQSWYCSTITARAGLADDAGMALLTAITATGTKPLNRNLGIYLGKSAKAGRHTTPEGVTLERSGEDSVGVLWSTKGV